MPKVFVTNFTGHSYEPATKFGELVYLTQGFVDFNKDYKSIRERINKFIENADKADYLLLSGNNLLCSIATLDWVRLHTVCKILHWNGVKHSYDLHTIV